MSLGPHFKAWSSQCTCAAAASGVLLLTLGLSVQLLLFPLGLKWQVHKNLELEPDTEGWRIWVRTFFKFLV